MLTLSMKALQFVTGKHCRRKSYFNRMVKINVIFFSRHKRIFTEIWVFKISMSEILNLKLLQTS